MIDKLRRTPEIKYGSKLKSSNPHVVKTGDPKPNNLYRFATYKLYTIW